VNGKRRTSPELTVADRMRMLPVPVRLFLSVLLVSLAYPGTATFYGAFLPADAGGVLGWSSKHLLLTWAGAVASVAAALLCLEPPRSRSARGYLAQLELLLVAVVRAYERDAEAELARRRGRADGAGDVAVDRA